MSSNVIVEIAILVGRLSCLLIFSQCMKPRSRTIGACKRLPAYRLLRIFIELFRDPVKKKSETKKETKKRANKQTNKQTETTQHYSKKADIVYVNVKKNPYSFSILVAGVYA